MRPVDDTPHYHPNDNNVLHRRDETTPLSDSPRRLFRLETQRVKWALRSVTGNGCGESQPSDNDCMTSSTRTFKPAARSAGNPITWVVLLIVLVAMMMMSIITDAVPRAFAANTQTISVQHAPTVAASAARTKQKAPSQAQMRKEMAEMLNWMLQATAPDSPFNGKASKFVSIGAKHNVDPLFIVAVAWKESAMGRAGDTSSQNAYGLTAQMKLKRFGSWDAGTASFARQIRTYQKSGVRTVAQIGARYAPKNRGWVRDVTRLYRDLGGNPKTAVTFPR